MKSPSMFPPSIENKSGSQQLLMSTMIKQNVTAKFYEQQREMRNPWKPSKLSRAAKNLHRTLIIDTQRRDLIKKTVGSKNSLNDIVICFLSTFSQAHRSFFSASSPFLCNDGKIALENFL